MSRNAWRRAIKGSMLMLMEASITHGRPERALCEDQAGHEEKGALFHRPDVLCSRRVMATPHLHLRLRFLQAEPHVHLAVDDRGGSKVLLPQGEPTAKSRQSPGTPFSAGGPRSSKRNPEPATRSLTVLEPKTSSGPANAATRAPMCSAMPPSLSPSTSHSPVCKPARIVTPASRTASLIEHAQRMARAGPSNVARKPSPAVSISRPRNWVSF